MNEVNVLRAAAPSKMVYAAHELDHFGLVCKYKNLGRPWTSAKLAYLLEGLGEIAETISLLKEARGRGLAAERTESVRELVRHGHSMVDIPAMLGLTLQEAVHALFDGNAVEALLWTEADWLAFESEILDDAPPTCC